MNNVFKTGVDTIIVRVYNFFKKEFDYLSKNYGDILDPTPFSKYKERTAEATGFHINVIERVLREEGQNEKNSRPQKRRKKERSKDHQDSSDTESFEETIDSGEDSGTRSCQPADQKDHSFATPSIEAPTAILKAEPLDELLEATSEHDSQTFENFAENEGVIVKVENQDLFKSHIIIKSEADAHKTEITENIADSIHDPAYQDSQQYRQDDRTPSSEALTAIVKAEPLDKLLEATSEHDSQTFENFAENEGVIVKVENQDLFESHINIKTEADADKTEIAENIEDTIHNPVYQDSKQYRQDDRTPSIEVPTAIVKAEPLEELLKGSPLQGIGDIVTEHDNNHMEVDDQTTKDHVQNPRHMIGDRLNQAPKTSTERSREYRARKALLKQQIKRQLELDAIKSASEDNGTPGSSEIMTLEKKRAKSAEATRRWREKKGAANKKPKNPAKSTAQLMREYRARKKMAASQSKQKPAVMVDSESLLATLRLMAENDPLKMETDNFECSENSDDDSDIVKEELDISDEGYG